MKKILYFLFVLFLFTACNKDEVQPTKPEITVLNKPERLAVLNPVIIRFNVKAEAGLASISVRHVVQNSIAVKTQNFKTPYEDEITYSHNTSFESVGQQLKYEITVTDVNNQSVTELVEFPVDKSEITIELTSATGSMTSIRRGFNTTVTAELRSTTSLYSVAVSKVYKDGTHKLISYKNNIQAMSQDFMRNYYKLIINLDPEDNVAAYRFDVEDNASEKISVKLPVQP